MAELPYGATIKVFNAEEAFDHLNGYMNCVICSQELGEVAYRIRVPIQERKGVHYLGLGAACCSEEHALCWLERDYPNRRFTFLLKTDGLPTRETKERWIYAFRKVGEYPKSTERSGKWLIWLSAGTIDRYWQEIKEAVEQGRLEDLAKVSTAASPDVQQGKPYVICVYTYDYEDSEDVMRVRQALRELGIRYKIIYKADEDTDHGHYGSEYTPKYRA